MVIVHSYVSLPKGISPLSMDWFQAKSTGNHVSYGVSREILGCFQQKKTCFNQSVEILEV